MIFVRFPFLGGLFLVPPGEARFLSTLILPDLVRRMNTETA